MHLDRLGIEMQLLVLALACLRTTFAKSMIFSKLQVYPLSTNDARLDLHELRNALFPGAVAVDAGINRVKI